MGDWVYVGKKEMECPHCKKMIETEIRIRYRNE